MHSRSSGPKLISSVVKYPLLRMLRCDSVAPFGKPVVPEVYWMLIGSLLSSVAILARRSSTGTDVRAVDEARPVVGADEQHLLQVRCVRPDLVDHADVVRRLERRRGDQGADARLLQHIGQFVGAVGRIDVDQDGADLRGRVLHDGPLGTVRRPHADALTAFDAQRHETACDHVDFVVEFGVRPPPTACHVNERVPVGVCRDRAFEVLPDRLLENRDVGRTCVG